MGDFELVITLLERRLPGVAAKHHRSKKIQHINHTIIITKKSPPEVNISITSEGFFYDSIFKNNIFYDSIFSNDRFIKLSLYDCNLLASRADKDSLRIRLHQP